MTVTFFNKERERQAQLEKELLHNVVVEPTSPESIGEVGEQPKEEPKIEEVVEVVKPKKKRKN